MVHVLAHGVRAAAAPRAVQAGQLRQHCALLRTKLLHSVLLLLLLACWRLLLDHHSWMVLVHVARVRRARLQLRGDVVRRRLRLHARRRAGAVRLGLRSG